VKRQERTLRIIAGQWRGRKFRFPDSAIRPTPDRVRETLFNWLRTHVEGARCLDLYAGSGALGLEALSRGASSVEFVERQRNVAQSLRELLQQWSANGAQVHCAPAQDYLKHAPGDARFDIVFLDPPFAEGAAGELVTALSALARGWLKPNARLYVEHARADAVRWPEAAWRELRVGTAGEVRYHLLEAASGPGVGRDENQRNVSGDL
jgi:16S rRNA (guanine966-N2)-methyltransferase